MNKLKNFKQLLREEDGMGTVEMILIIVEIFTIYKGVNNVDYGCNRGRSKTLYTVGK